MGHHSSCIGCTFKVVHSWQVQIFNANTLLKLPLDALAAGLPHENPTLTPLACIEVVDSVDTPASLGSRPQAPALDPSVPMAITPYQQPSTTLTSLPAAMGPVLPFSSEPLATPHLHFRQTSLLREEPPTTLSTIDPALILSPTPPMAQVSMTSDEGVTENDNGGNTGEPAHAVRDVERSQAGDDLGGTTTGDADANSDDESMGEPTAGDAKASDNDESMGEPTVGDGEANSDDESMGEPTAGVAEANSDDNTMGEPIIGDVEASDTDESMGEPTAGGPEGSGRAEVESESDATDPNLKKARKKSKSPEAGSPLIKRRRKHPRKSTSSESEGDSPSGTKENPIDVDLHVSNWEPMIVTDFVSL